MHLEKAVSKELATKRELALVPPPHPGEVLRHDFMKPRGITSRRLAEETGLSARRVFEVEIGARRITIDTARRLAAYLGTSSQFWLTLQYVYDQDVRRRDR